MTLAVTLSIDELRALVRSALREEMSTPREVAPPIDEQVGATERGRIDRTATGLLHDGCRQNGFVYWIGEGIGDPVKIGWSDHPERRLVELQPGNPCELRLLLKIRACAADELRLHAKFERDRLRGEWFAWSEAVDRLYRALASEALLGNEILASEVRLQ